MRQPVLLVATVIVCVCSLTGGALAAKPKPKLPGPNWATTTDIQVALALRGFVLQGVRVMVLVPTCVGVGPVRRYPVVPVLAFRYFSRFTCQARTFEGAQYRIAVTSVSAGGRHWRGTAVLTRAAPPPPAVTFNFSGSGEENLAPFSTPVGEELCWTSSWADGADIGDPNGDFTAFDNVTDDFIVDANNTASGCSWLPPGNHQFHVSDEGTWTISIHA